MGETFKQRMKRLRLRAGLKSQREAAEAIGCERGTVGMWEAPSSEVASVGEWLLETAKAYKVRPEYLKTGSGLDGYPWSPQVAQLPGSSEAEANQDFALASLRNDVHALRQALAVLAVAMVRHRPAEARDVADLLQQVPENFQDRGFLNELLTTLGAAAEAGKRSKV